MASHDSNPGFESGIPLSSSSSPVSDLGEDLLEPTRFSPQLGGASTARPTSPDELIRNAEILLNEGLPDEAKRLLHQVLIADPSHSRARHALDRIHDEELKQILEGRESPRSRTRSEISPPLLGVIDPEQVLQRLDEDLALGLTSPLLTELAEDAEASMRAMQAFLSEVDRAMVGATYQDRIDLGVGFLQMELYDAALAHWQAASRLTEDARLRLQASALRALALVLARRPYEASSELQPVLADQEIAWDDKTELLYWMARASEARGDVVLAASWYEQVLKQDPLYRDAASRKHRLLPRP